MDQRAVRTVKINPRGQVVWAAYSAEQYPCARQWRARIVRTRRTRTVSGPRDWRLPLAVASGALLLGDLPSSATLAAHRVRLSGASARISTSRASQNAQSRRSQRNPDAKRAYKSNQRWQPI